VPGRNFSAIFETEKTAVRTIFKYISVILVFVSGCKKSDDATPQVVSESKFFITNVDAKGQGVISTYKKPGGVTRDPAYTLAFKNSTPELISDFQIYDGKMYMVRSGSALIEVASTSDLSQVQSIQYAKPRLNNYYKHLAITDGKIFIADRDFVSAGSGQNTAFLKVVTLGKSTVDSIGIMKNVSITAVAAGNGRVYVSAGLSPQTLYAIDAKSYAIVATVPIIGFCTDLILDKDGNVLAFYNGRMTQFSSNNLSVMKDRLINGAPVNIDNDDTISTTAYAIDKDNNIIYFLANAPQPAPAPYFLNAYDLKTDEITRLSNQFISAETVGFDQTDQQIILGSFDIAANKGQIKFLTTKAEIKEQFAIFGSPLGIRAEQ
jgi:hypothetical protein